MLVELNSKASIDIKFKTHFKMVYGTRFFRKNFKPTWRIFSLMVGSADKDFYEGQDLCPFSQEPQIPVFFK